MFKKFKDFVVQQNTISMAVGIIIGYAMTGLTKSLTNNLINPLIGLFFGKINFASLSFTVGQAQFKYGAFLNAIINFLFILLVVFILAEMVSKAINYQKQKKPEEINTILLRQIRDDLNRQNCNNQNDSHTKETK